MLDEQCSFFEKNGYLVVNGFFPSDAVHRCQAFLKAALATEVSAIFRRWEIDLLASDCVEKMDTLLKNPGKLSPTDKHLLMGHFPLEVRLSKLINPLPELLGKSRLLQAILGSTELFMHMPPMMRFVPPGYNHADVPAHQDVSYNRHLSSFITIWTPMVPITKLCGGLIIYKGSQNMDVVINEIQEDESRLPPIDVQGMEKLQLVGLNEGDVVILSPYIVHASASNFSDSIRLSADFRVFGRYGTSQKHYLDLKKMQAIGPDTIHQQAPVQ